MGDGGVASMSLLYKCEKYSEKDREDFNSSLAWDRWTDHEKRNGGGIMVVHHHPVVRKHFSL